MIVSRFVIELMGRPKEIVSKGLDKIIKTFEERYPVLHKELSKPKKVKDTTFFSAFIEVEFEVKTFQDLFSAMLDFGPTVVEILEPKELKIKRGELQDVITDLMTKLHTMSKLIQELGTQNLTLNQKIDSLQASNKKQ